MPLSSLLSSRFHVHVAAVVVVLLVVVVILLG